MTKMARIKTLQCNENSWKTIPYKYCPLPQGMQIHSAIASWIHSYFDNVMMKLIVNSVPVKSKLQHLRLGITRAFDAFSRPGGREFDKLSLPGGGAFDHHS